MMRKQTTTRFSSQSIRLLVFAGCLGGIVWAAFIGVRSLQNENRVKNEAELVQNLASNLEDSAFNRFHIGVRQLANSALAQELARGAIAPDAPDALSQFYAIRDVLKAEVVYVLNAKGIAVACTRFGNNETLTGGDYSFRPYFQNAIRHSSSTKNAHSDRVYVMAALGVTTKTRGFYFSYPIYDSVEDAPIGVAVMKIGIEEVDQLITRFSQPSLLLSPDGIVFATNQPEWLYHAALPITPERLEEIRTSRQFSSEPLNPLPFLLKNTNVDISGKSYFVAEADVHLMSGWKVATLSPDWIQYPLNPAQKQLLIGGIVVVVFLILLVGVLLKTITQRKMVEAELIRSRDELDAQVKIRTAELEQSTALLEATLESNADGVLVIDQHERVARFNRSFKEIWQAYNLEIGEHENVLRDIASQSVVDPETFKKRISQIFESIDQDSYDIFDFQDGRALELRSQPQRLDGKVIGRVWNCRDITDQILSERERELLAKFPDEDPNPVLRCRADGVLMYANSAATPLLSAWDVRLGKKVTGVWGERITHSFQSSTNFRYEDTFAGQTFTIVLTPIPEAGYVNIYAMNITERRRAEEALRESEQQTRAIMDNVDIGITLISPDMRILTMNRKMKEWYPELSVREHPHCYNVYNTPPRTEPCGYCPTIKTLRDGQVHEAITITPMPDGLRNFRIVSSPIRNKDGGVIAAIELVEDITDRQKAEEYRRRLATAVEQCDEMVVITDREGTIQYINPAFTRITGYTWDEAVGKNPSLLKSGKQPREVYEDLWTTIAGGEMWVGNIINKKKDGSTYHERMTITPIRNENGEVYEYVAIKRDVTQEVETEQQLRQSQKLESIGQLAAGIAHEINTPTQYVGDNIRFLMDGFQDVVDVLTCQAQLLDCKEPGERDALLIKLKELADHADLDYLCEEIPTAIEQSLDGVIRVSKIVAAMKDFSHPHAGEGKSLIDLNRAIESTVTVARNEWKYVAEVEFDLDSELPLVSCLAGELNQVILNVLINAAHAIGDRNKEQGMAEKGTITLRTRREDSFAMIEIQDTGIGISEENQGKIFDPFFTTKEVGRGTGQGLGIVRSIIIDKHGGTIDVQSQVNVGTTFILRLPLDDVTSPVTSEEQEIHG